MIVRIIILLLCTTTIYAQDKSIEFEIFLAKDTVRLFEPIEYCFKRSNTSDDTIKTASYEVGYYNTPKTLPKLEIRSKHHPEWVELWHSDINLRSEDKNIPPGCSVGSSVREVEKNLRFFQIQQVIDRSFIIQDGK